MEIVAYYSHTRTYRWFRDPTDRSVWLWIDNYPYNLKEVAK